MSIQTAMLVALGFLAASLLGLLLASAFWSRAVRLTTIRIKQSMPVSESEIKADRDRLRAEYAIKVHKLETQLDQAKLERARHLIDINRRDASISALESNVGQYKADLEENQNARRVLEQTVTDRLPKVEARLSEAKRLLFNRDREIADLTQGAKKHKLALEEASSVHAQQHAQIERLSSVLTTRTGRPRSDNLPESESALRSEVEALRHKTREQAILIDRLQVRLGHGYLLPGAGSTPSTLGTTQPAAQAEGDMDRLRQDLSEAEAALSAARSAGGTEADAIRAGMEREIRGLKARAEDQAGEIARLRAALSAFEQFDGKSVNSLGNSKIALKAKLGSAQAQADQQATTITRLRAELAAAHERLARQAAHFMGEMRRIGAGSVPTSGQARRPQRSSEQRLAERV
jgi:chromosome segregation ATPase